MTTAMPLNTWKDAATVYFTAGVNEGGAMGNVEYNVSTPLNDEKGIVKLDKQLQDELQAALIAAHAAQHAKTPQALPALMAVPIPL